MVSIVVTVSLLLAGSSAADDPSAQVEAAFTALTAQHPERVAREVIGESRAGRALVAFRIGPVARADAPLAPALLIVAGLDGRLGASTRIALEIARGLAEDVDALARATLYVVPLLNPDAAARHVAGTQPAWFGGALTPFDDDHDGRRDEDAPVDVDGDGHVTWMRVFDPPPWMERTHLADPEDARLSRPAERARGERPAFALVREGFDQDGDGSYAEDGPGGVDLDQNFPARFAEHAAHAGPFALSEPETHALVEWLVTRPDIAAALVLGSADSVMHAPPTGKMDATGRAPEGLERDDAPYHEAVKALYQEIVAREKVAKLSPDGALATWLYAHFGVPAFALDVSRSPSDGAAVAPDAAADAADEAAPAAAPDAAADGTKDAGGARGKPARDAAARKRPDPEKDELAWLAASTRLGQGFVPFRPFDHPTLGRVEIGGALDLWRLDPPAEVEEDVSAQMRDFARALLERLPRVTVLDPVVEALGAGVQRVSVTVQNDGTLPSTSASGERTRRLQPITLVLPMDAGVLLSGERVQRAPAIAGGGGSFRAEWLVSAPPGATLLLSLRASMFGTRDLLVTIPQEVR